MDREPIGIGRLSASDCQAIISAIIGVDLPMPEKPTLAAARWWPVWRWHLRCSAEYKGSGRRISPPSGSVPQRQHRGVKPALLTADPAPRYCWAAAAAQRVRAAAAQRVRAAAAPGRPRRRKQG